MAASAAALVAGLVMLVVGADLVVREGTVLAGRFGVSPLVVGMTVVSLGTSLPELAIGVTAAHQGNGGLAVGNIVGTNLVNVLLVLGLSALIRPVAFERRTLRFDLPVMVGAALLLLALARDGTLTNADGLVLCGYGVAYLALVVLHARRAAPAATAAPAKRTRPVALQVVLLVAGLAVIVVGSEFLVDGAVRLAREWGASDTLIGLTVVAIGTSAPSWSPASCPPCAATTGRSHWATCSAPACSTSR